MLRILVNQWEVDQQLMQYGIGGLTEGLYNQQVTQPNGQTTSLAASASVLFNSPVTTIDLSGLQPLIYYNDPNNGPSSYLAQALIVATTTRSMEFMGLTLPSDSGNNLLPQPSRVAIRNLPLTNSSKLFIRTATKFWQGTNMPQNIQTDELPRGLYCLDYPQTDYGVVLISYTFSPRNHLSKATF